MVGAGNRARNSRRAGVLLALAALLAGALIYLAARSSRAPAERSAPAHSARVGAGEAETATATAPAPAARGPRAQAALPATHDSRDAAAAPASPPGRPNEATPRSGFGDDEANDVFYDKQIAVHEAGMSATQGPTECHTAYNSFWAMQVAFYKYEQVRPSEARYPDGEFRTPWDAIKAITEDDYVALCQKLPADLQKCLTYRHYAQAYEACTAVERAYVEDLPGRGLDYEAVALGMPALPEHWRGAVRARWRDHQESGGGEK